MRLRSWVAATAAAALAAVCPGPAQAGAGGAGSGGSGGGDYGVGASYITVTGDVDPGLRGSVAQPPPLCWWEPWQVAEGVDPSDVEAVKKAWDQWLADWGASSTTGAYTLALDYDRFEAAIRAVARGESVTFYQLQYDTSRLPAGDNSKWSDYLHAHGCGSGLTPGPYGSFLRSIDWFPTGEQPAPVIDPEALAVYAYEVMDLVEPTLEWNPQLKEVGGASWVNAATWLWVEDAEAVGERSVTATAGPVSATVTANTDGLAATSPAGTTQCDAAEARRAYAAGVSEAEACTLTFTRASWGYGAGFPVEASTVWQATWTSSTGAGGTLENRSQGATTYIPVVETQSLVEDVG